jgi:hypothetical protein
MSDLLSKQKFKAEHAVEQDVAIFQSLQRDRPSSFELKNDSYRKAAGGRSQLFDIYCANCKTPVLTYQKDGIPGQLKKCFLNRILWPEGYGDMLKQGLKVSQIPNLTCPNCNTVLGTPFVYMDGRIAFRIIRSRVSRKPNYNVKE